MRITPSASVRLVLLACLLLALPSLAASEKEGATPPVDINTAGVEELQSVPGIGPSLARKIVDHRREHGPFRRVEDLLEIRGIGEKSLEKLRGRITVSKAKKG
jgi:competence protein ComEA